MTIAVDPITQSRLPLIKSWAEEACDLAAEVELAKGELPKLQVEICSREQQLKATRPSLLLRFDEIIADQFMRLRRCELLRSALVSSHTSHSMRLTRVESDLSREISETIDRLIKANSGPEARAAIRATHVASDPAHANAERLLTLCNANLPTLATA